MKLFPTLSLLSMLHFFPLLGGIKALPQEAFEKQRVGLLGDWNGEREKLNDKGIIFTGSYFNDLLGNPSGGNNQGFTSVGSLGLNFEIDFGKADKVKGLHFFSSFVWRTGTSLSKKYIGNQFPVQQLYGNESYRLNELYLKQYLFHDRLILKAGRIDGGNDFFQSPLYYEFVSNAFCGNPIGIFFNAPFTAYPNATWGAYVAVKPTKRILAKFAIYTGNEKSLTNEYHGTNFTFKHPQGNMLMTEWSYQVNQLDKDQGLPGNYRAGYYYVTQETHRYLDNEAHNNYGYYILLDQMVYKPKYGDKEHGLSPFVCLLFAPKDRNKFPLFFNAGLVYKGIPGRPNDSANVGFSYGHYSTDLREVERRAKHSGLHSTFGNKPQNFEAGLEVNYWVQINKWLVFTPDFQYVINPKGYGTIKNAYVLGAQIGITL